jgi:hypothetical protein
MKKFIGILISLICLPGHGAYNGAISAATAGTGRAAGEVSDSPFLNPSTISFLRGYFFSSSYSTASEFYSGYTISITDTLKETVIPTAAAYSQGTMKTKDGFKASSRDFRLAMAEKVGGRFALGLSGHYKNDRTDWDSFGQTNLTLGAVLAVTENLSAGLVFDDFLGPPATIPQEFRLKPTIGTGLSYNYKKVVRARLDVVSAENNTLTRPTYGAGVESFMNKWMILRLGVGHDTDKNSNIYSAGVGFRGPKFGLHYAYSSSTEDENPVRHSVDLAIPIW